jgi:polyferredoxin
LARDKKIKKGDSIKWLLWVPWVSAILIVAIRAGGYKNIDFFYGTDQGLSIGSPRALIVYLIIVLVLMALPAYIFGKRSFCHHICWMAPFIILGRKARNLFLWPSLKLIAEPSVCQHCHTCAENCRMSLPVEDMVQSNNIEKAECILCCTCIDSCPANVIKYSFAAGK